MAEKVVSFNGVTQIFSKGLPTELKALDNINLSIEKNEFVAIVGHTGSGKSTLVQHINGLIKPMSGTMTVNGKEINSSKKQKSLLEIRKEAGLVFQFPEAQLFEETVQKDIEFGPKNFGVEADKRHELSRELINVVGLDESYLAKSPFDLSGGQKRRVAIAGILAMEPEILILDEPTAGLDPVGQVEIMNMIKELHSRGKTIILVTHDMDTVLKYASRVIVMKEGVVISDNTPEKTFETRELLEELGIDLPQITKFIHDLNDNGYNIPTNIKTIDALAEYLGGDHNG